MTSSAETDRLDAVAAGYHLTDGFDDKEFDRYFHELCAEWILPYIQNSRRVLQMGFGEGYLARVLEVEGCEMHLVEGSVRLAQVADQLLGSRVRIHNHLFEEFEPLEKFDCIVATNVLEHVVDPIQILRRMKDWLAPGGKVLVTVPNAESLHRQLGVQMGLQREIYDLSARDHAVGHLRVYDTQTLTRDCLQAGFVIDAKRGFVLKVLSNSLQKLLPKDVIYAMHKISPLIPTEIQANLGFVLVNEAS